MALRGLARIACAATIACLLSACWMSEKPLIAANDAAIIPFAGAYHGDGENRQKLMIIAPAPTLAHGTAYELTDGKSEDRVPSQFVALGHDWYLMQGEGDGGSGDGAGDGGRGAQPFYLYQLVRAVNRDVYFYSPNCEDVRGGFKGLKREKGELESCNFSRLDGLESMARAWIAKLESGEIANEPEILRRASR